MSDTVHSVVECCLRLLRHNKVFTHLTAHTVISYLSWPHPQTSHSHGHLAGYENDCDNKIWFQPLDNIDQVLSVKAYSHCRLH